MTKTKPHPRNYHKDEDARDRCLACNESGALDISAEDRAKAVELKAAGYRGTSNKYRTVSRIVLPPFEEVVTIADSVPEWMRKHLKETYTNYPRYMLGTYGESLELTASEYRAFKQLENGTGPHAA